MSAAQLSRAPAHARVEYRIAAAESSGLNDDSVDLVVVAQALHWFDRDRFYAEVRRVAVESGVLAAWTYRLRSLGDAVIDRALTRFYEDVVGPYWPAERRLVDSDYRTIEFPFAEIQAPQFDMTAQWTLPQLLGYLRTWSATKRYVEARGHDPVTPLAEELGTAWGSSKRRPVVWWLTVRAGRVLAGNQPETGTPR